MKVFRRFVLFSLVVVSVLVVMALFADRSVPVQAGSQLVVTISGQYVESDQPPLLSRLFDDGGRPFLSLLSVLKLAERDDRIDRVVLRIRDTSMGWGKASELRNAISRLRAAGRHTVALLETESVVVNRAYFIATAADEVHVVPGALVPLLGLSAEYVYFGDMWDEFGIEIQATRVGRYKSAVETFANNGMSDASREMYNALLDGAQQRFVAAIAEGRALPEARVEEIIDEGLVTPSELLERGMIDGVHHLPDLVDEDAPLLLAADYAGANPAETGFDPQHTVALVYGSGLVVSGEASRSSSGAPVFASERVVRALEDAAADPSVEGIVLRLDSPGGSPLAAEAMWNAVRRVREQGIPVVASVSDVAASAAYYIASAADEIVLAPGALTGSIGVFSLYPVFEKLMERWGIESETLTRGRHAQFLSATSVPSAGARERLQRITDEVYRLFVERVAEGRGLETGQVDTVGQGRVWNARQAIEIGLADELGGVREAVDVLLRRLGHEEGSDVSLITYPAPPTLADEIAQLIQSGSFATRLLSASPFEVLAAQLPLPPGMEGLREWWAALRSEGPLLLPTAWIDIR